MAYKKVYAKSELVVAPLGTNDMVGNYFLFLYFLLQLLLAWIYLGYTLLNRRSYAFKN